VLKLIDTAVLRFMRTRGHWPPLEKAVIRYSKLGEHSAIWFGIALVGAAAVSRQRPIYLRLIRALMAVEVINALLKIVIGRKRPHLDGLPPLATTRSQRSCPSAHSASSFAAARILSQVLPSAPVHSAAVLMAVSRPYLGVHYPSDVLAGMALGTVIAESVPAACEKCERPSAPYDKKRRKLQLLLRRLS
jgi:undecaprenyl-diphosphatase